MVPYVIDAVLFADIFTAIERRGTVSIADDEYMVRWEDFQCSDEGCWKDLFAFISRDYEGSVLDVASVFISYFIRRVRIE
jgi:hypothetical protein